MKNPVGKFAIFFAVLFPLILGWMMVGDILLERRLAQKSSVQAGGGSSSDASTMPSAQGQHMTLVEYPADFVGPIPPGAVRAMPSLMRGQYYLGQMPLDPNQALDPKLLARGQSSLDLHTRLPGRKSSKFVKIVDVVPGGAVVGQGKQLYEMCLMSTHGWGEPLSLNEVRMIEPFIQIPPGASAVYCFYKGDHIHGGTGTIAIGKFEFGRFNPMSQVYTNLDPPEIMNTSYWLDVR